MGYCEQHCVGPSGENVLLLGSEGSQMEGNNAKAVRLAVAQQLNVKLVINDNDITITGKPSQYLPGFQIEQTLAGHGVSISVVQDSKDIVALYDAVRTAVRT